MGCGCKLDTKAPKGCGSCPSKVAKRLSKCATYTITTKSPFDVGVATEHEVEGGNSREFLLLLSGRHHASEDEDKDSLPDWVGVGRRPCRVYRSVSTGDLLDLFQRRRNSDDPCKNTTSYKSLHPNAILHYNLVTGVARTSSVEILEVHTESDGRGPILAVHVRCLEPENEEDGSEQEDLPSRLFAVNVTIDHTKPFTH